MNTHLKHTAAATRLISVSRLVSTIPIISAHRLIRMALIASACLTFAGCSKSFSDRPPVDQITVDNFYQTAAQVQASTNVLYGAPWFGYNTKVSWSISELYGGNGRTYSGDVINFGNFSVTSSNFELSAAWNS